jgi:anti-sigma28 factor (negative regulator of flagellin synthesis)
MTVRPTTSGQTPRPAIGRTDRTAASASTSRPTEANTPAASGVRRDDVQISAQARQLQQLDSAARATGGDLSADRLKQILGRMNDGHYDQPDVQDKVIRNITRDL